MKSLLIVLTMITASMQSFSQAATIKITNNNPTCTAYVWVYAEDIPSGNNACDIVFGGNGIMLPPGGTTSIAPVGWAAFGALYGINSVSPIPAMTTNFQWTDVVYQWGCPPGCGLLMPPTDNSGLMSDLFAATTCFPATNSYTGVGCTAGTSTWGNAATVGLMDNILINLN